MRKALFFLLISFLSLGSAMSCGGGKGKLGTGDTSRWTDQDVPLEELPTGTVNTDSLLILDEMKKEFPVSDSLVEGRPASWYLNRRDISNTARAFYLMKFVPSDDDATFALCDSILTKNDTTRPFYFFLFQRIMRLADGALSEGITEYAQRYVLQYPEDFFKRIGSPVYKQFYNDWVSVVAFELEVPGTESPTVDEVRNYILQEQIKHSLHLNSVLKAKISLFADDVAKQAGKQ